MEVLAVGNQKGGTSKTTTTGMLGVLLARQGIRTHLIDMDPQASLTAALGRRDDDGLLYQALQQRAALPIVPVMENLSLTPSSVDLARAESEFIGEPAREAILQTALEQSELGDDVLVIIDCPPSLGVLALNCLTAATKLLVTVQPGGFELQALGRLQQTVTILRDRVNPQLTIIGIVLTNCIVRRSITEQMRQELSKIYPVLGVVRTDAQLLYATTEGRLPELREGNALADYQQVIEALTEQLTWRVRSVV